MAHAVQHDLGHRLLAGGRLAPSLKVDRLRQAVQIAGRIGHLPETEWLGGGLERLNGDAETVAQGQVRLDRHPG